MSELKCPPKSDFLDYLNGWSDGTKSDWIESHLPNCSDCETAVRQLENDTRVDFPIEPLAESNGSGSATFQQGESDIVTAAIEAIKQSGISETDALPVPANSQSQVPQPDGGDFGNYELMESIGRGGMAEVYRGRHRRLKRIVAIKLIHVPGTHMAESLQRIEREMEALGRLTHSSIVGAFDAGEHNGVQFLVTEFVDGVDLSKLARAVPNISVANACQIIRDAAIGLDHAHANGIVHRDIKPSNLMLGRDGKIKILDFGLVQLDGWNGATAEITTVGQLLGTLDYMSPEQAERADTADYRSDIYSLGATLFRLLAGRAPYAASTRQSPLEKLRLLANEKPPRITTLREDIPQELANIVARSLDRNPTNRPASAAHLAEQLQPFCEGANLSELISEATAITAANDPADSNHSSIAADRFSKAASGPAPATKPIGRKPRRLLRWAVALTTIAAFVFGGIVIVLETQKGKVIIETDSPNMHVQLVADGVTRKEIELVPGENSTRIYAGDYEILIDVGSDRYVIDQNSFQLKRGETVVAKITVDPQSKTAAVDWSGDQQPSTTPPTETLVDEGYPGPRFGNTTHDGEIRNLRSYEIGGAIDLYRKIAESVFGDESGSRMVVDPMNSPLRIYATEAEHQRLTELFSALSDATRESAVAETRTIKAYQIGADIELYRNIAETVLGGDSNARLNVSETNSQLIVFATFAQHQRITEAFSAISSATSVTPVYRERVYNGRTLAEWRNLIEFETNSPEIEDAANGIQALVSGDPELLKEIREWIVYGIENDNSGNWRERLVTRIGLEQSQIDELLRFLQDASPSQTLEIVSVLSPVSRFAYSGENLNMDQWLALLPQLWSRDDIRETVWEQELGKQLLFTPDQLRSLTESNRHSLLQFIKSHKQLDPLVRKKLLDNAIPNSRRDELPEEDKSILLATAIDILCDDAAKQKDEVFGESLLRAQYAFSKPTVGASQVELTQLLDATISTLLDSDMLESQFFFPAGQTWSSGAEFQFSDTNLPYSITFTRIIINKSFSRVFFLLSFAERIGKPDSSHQFSGMKRLLEPTRNDYDRLNLKIAEMFESRKLPDHFRIEANDLSMCQISWINEKSVEVSSDLDINKRLVERAMIYMLANKFLNGDDETETTETETESTSGDSETEATGGETEKGDEVSSASPDTSSEKPEYRERVYNGRTLDEWRNLIEFETNESEIGDAANAIQALVSNDPELLHEIHNWIVSSTINGSPGIWPERLVLRLGLAQSHVDELVNSLPKANPTQALKVVSVLSEVSVNEYSGEQFNLEQWLALFPSLWSRDDFRESKWEQELNDMLSSAVSLVAWRSESDRLLLYSFVGKHGKTHPALRKHLVDGSLNSGSVRGMNALSEEDKSYLFPIALDVLCFFAVNQSDREFGENYIRVMDVFPESVSNDVRNSILQLVDKTSTRILETDSIDSRFSPNSNDNFGIKTRFQGHDEELNIYFSRLISNGPANRLQFLLAIAHRLGKPDATSDFPGIESVREKTRADYQQFCDELAKTINWDTRQFSTTWDYRNESMLLVRANEDETRTRVPLAIDPGISERAIIYMLANEFLNGDDENEKGDEEE